MNSGHGFGVPVQTHVSCQSCARVYMYVCVCAYVFCVCVCVCMHVFLYVLYMCMHMYVVCMTSFGNVIVSVFRYGCCGM